MANFSASTVSILLNGTYVDPGYFFEGFAAPLHNDGTLNLAKADRVIPLKWRLFDGLEARIEAIEVPQYDDVGISREYGGCVRPENLIELAITGISMLLVAPCQVRCGQGEVEVTRP